MKKKLPFLILLISIITISRINAQNDTCLYYMSPGISFPPVENQSQRTFSETHLDTLNVKKIRFAENWASREPTQGNFVWQPLDERINWAYNKGYEILLTIQSNGPDWACSSLQNGQSCVFNDNNQFKTYIDSLLQRYSNKISKIQFGNEWQAQYWYIGSAQDFIEANNVLFHSVQANSPSTQVVLGGFTSISLRFMAGCNGYVNSFYGGDGTYYDATYLANNCSSTTFQNLGQKIDSVLRFAKYDMLDIHLYDDVEQWDEYYRNFTDTITKPVIVSEFGGPNMNYEPYTDSYQADRLYQYMKKLDSLQIPEAYFFKLVEGTNNPAHSTSGLIDDITLTEKPAYYVFKSFSTCVASINHTKFNNLITFYPNPMKDFTNINFQNFNSNHPKNILIYNIDGRLTKIITNVNNKRKFILKKDNLSAGLYFVKIIDFKGIVAQGKLIVK